MADIPAPPPPPDIFRIAFSSCLCQSIGCRGSHPLLNLEPAGFSFVGTTQKTRSNKRKSDVGPFGTYPPTLTDPTYFRPLQVVTTMPQQNKIHRLPVFLQREKISEIKQRWNVQIEVAIQRYHKPMLHRVGEVHAMPPMCLTITGNQQITEILLLLPPPMEEGDEVAIVGGYDNDNLSSVFTIPQSEIPPTTDNTRREKFAKMKVLLNSLKY